ncbi:unnamed protein product [Adineta steineri]|uniref:FAD-binding FR-type domain-containing protein n=1 Tax=Adineta steineri TaxID=433720 RepID=A0A815AXQ8_9BILA|nr:unnamed protein product [Adineta steineri]
MLILMLRKHITWLRSKGGGILLPLDHHIDIHKTIGIIIMIETALHTAAHLAYLGYVFYICSLSEDIGSSCNNNSTNIHQSNLYNQSLNNAMIVTKRYRFDSLVNKCVPFGFLGCGGNWNHFHTENLCVLRCKPYRDTYHRYVDAIFTAKLGLGYITGVLEFLLGALIYIMCLPFVRKSGHFQLFYWCHMLTLPWLIIMLVHGPRFWKWLLIPGILYIIEKILRYRKSRSNKHGETFIMEAILLPSQVIHLVINKPRKFTYKPGDYIYINIPAVASFEWHPFSISSAPEHKDSIWLHVRASGHWTRRVYDLFRMKLKQEHGGGMLNFNCALMLILMLRKHITWLRSKGGGILLPLDHHIDIHKTIGIIIMIETALHTAAHLAYLGYVFYICSLSEDIGSSCNNNSTNIHRSNLYNQSLNNEMIVTKRYRFDSLVNKCVPFGYLGCGGNWNHFHTENLCVLRCKPYRDTYHRYVDAIFTAKLGLGYITGVLEFLLGALIYIMCLPFVRKSGHFQLFYWCHMLTLPWLIIMLVHGPRFWKWLLIPGILYIIEKILRYRKSRSNKHGETFIMEAILLPSQVIHLVINKPRKFTYKPGDYIYINIPAVASFEWHPFSISSAPEHKDSIWLHVRASGHWTRRVYDLFRMKLKQEHGGVLNDFNDLRLRSSMRSRMSKSYIDELRDSIWLHVRASGHWTRRVYDLFRMKLKQEHGGVLNDFNDLRLRSSMRSRMSKSYIDELRGVNQQEDHLQFDLNNNNDDCIQSKAVSVSFPLVNKNQRRSICSSCHSTLSLHDIQLNSKGRINQMHTEENHTNATILINPSTLDNLTVEEIEKYAYEQDDVLMDEQQIKPMTRLKPAIKNNNNNNPNRLTVPSIGDYCIRISNISTDNYEQKHIEFSETRFSDALGYLRMYKNHNRIQFNTLQFNDREDLQVLIDGPYGAPSQHIFEAEHAVLIAAGIGITPFASILQSIMCRYRNRRHKCPHCEFIWNNPESEELRIKKVDFIWVTREQRSLEWFISLLAQMEIEQQRLRQNSDKGPLLEVHLYVTSAQSPIDLKALNVYLSLDLIGRENSSNCDAIDGLRQRIKHGRPKWEQVFTDLLSQKKGKISVFYCGPPALSAELTTKCRKYGFAYKKELF